MNDQPLNQTMCSKIKPDFLLNYYFPFFFWLLYILGIKEKLISPVFLRKKIGWHLRSKFLRYFNTAKLKPVRSTQAPEGNYMFRWHELSDLGSAPVSTTIPWPVLCYSLFSRVLLSSVTAVVGFELTLDQQLLNFRWVCLGLFLAALNFFGRGGGIFETSPPYPKSLLFKIFPCLLFHSLWKTYNYSNICNMCMISSM